ncbi:MAG: DUF2358 domain-containing protein [Oculatellaceae cyanobacterium Prado106]|nr:DUF2358 domain-containing protein [Oculatellaceae cyanobacterium Prado106]
MSETFLEPPTTDILAQLSADYARFPKQQSFELYAANVYFKDPMNEFVGRDRYQKMIAFLDTWLQDLKIDLHQIQQNGSDIRTDWTLRLTPPLPWKPKVVVDGWSELKLDSAGLIISHIDYWHCSRLAVLKQHLPF